MGISFSQDHDGDRGQVTRESALSPGTVRSPLRLRRTIPVSGVGSGRFFPRSPFQSRTCQKNRPVHPGASPNPS